MARARIRFRIVHDQAVMLNVLISFFFLFTSPLMANASAAKVLALPIIAQNAPAAVPAPDAETQDQKGNPSLVTKLAVLAGLSLLPFAIMLLTSFMKIVVVLSLLRNALGVQQTPPNQVLNGIALLISIYVMFPTGLKMYQAAETVIKTSPPVTMIS